MSKEQTLYDIGPIKKQKPLHTCKTCVHIQKWACGGSYFFYCGIRKSNRTGNGLLKVKCKREACGLYKEEE